MKLISRLRCFFTACLFLVLSQAAYGYSAGDYYNAGLQLYNARNYGQAAQYFTAALSLEPNNTAALQGRANSYYSLGQFPQALADYQKVQALSPSNQLAQLIQALQAKVGSSAPAGSTVPPAAPGESFNQGVALYQQKQYAAAVPALQKAARENPNDANAYYYLGASYLGLGDAKNAALNLAISNRKQPNPSVEAYVTQLKARLTPEDQQWMDGQLAASTAAGAAGVSGPKANKNLGIRLEPGLTLLTLTDFTSNAESQSIRGEALRNSDPSITYNGVVPTGCLNVRLEPVLKLSPNFELGLPIGMMPVGTASETTQNDSGFTMTDSYNISAFTVGVNARYLLGAGDIQPFIAGGILVAPISIDYLGTFGFPTDPNNYDSAKGTFMGMAFGGQAQLGLDWHLGDMFCVSPFVGYQVASAGDFSADVQGGGGKAQLSVVPTADGNLITPVAGGKFVMHVIDSKTVYFPGDDVPAGTKPLSVDLGGVTAGVQISAFF